MWIERWRRPQWQWGCTSWKYHSGVQKSQNNHNLFETCEGRLKSDSQWLSRPASFHKHYTFLMRRRCSDVGTTGAALARGADPLCVAGQRFRQPDVSLAFFTGLVFACSAPSTVPCANVCHMVAPSWLRGMLQGDAFSVEMHYLYIPAALPKQPFLSKMQMVNYLWQWLEVHGHERLFTFKIVQEVSPMVFYVQVRFFYVHEVYAKNKLQNKRLFQVSVPFLCPWPGWSCTMFFPFQQGKSHMRPCTLK